jgi:hypothetical protein
MVAPCLDKLAVQLRLGDEKELPVGERMLNSACQHRRDLLEGLDALDEEFRQPGKTHSI